MKRSIKIGFPIVCILVVGGTLIALGNLSNKANKISSKNETNTVNTSVKNEVNNNVVSEYPNFSYNANTVSNTNVENKVDESKKNENKTSNQDVTNNKTEVTDEKNDTPDKEKALELAKKEWGEDNSVYFTNEGVSSGKYIVAVRDKSNTAVKLFYKIDLNTKIVEVDWE